MGSIAWLAARPVSQNLATRVERRMRGETHGERLDDEDDEGRDEVGFGGGAEGRGGGEDDDAREMRGVASFRVDTPPLPPGAGASRV